MNRFASEEAKRDQIVDVFDNYATKDYKYLDSRHLDQGSQLAVNFELIEEVVFRMIDTVNLQLDHHFKTQA